MSEGDASRGLALTPAMIEFMQRLLVALLGEHRSLLETRVGDTPVLPIDEDECARLLCAVAAYTSGEASPGVVLGLAKLDALSDYMDFVRWYMGDLGPHIERMGALYKAGAPALAVQGREVFIAADDCDPHAFVGQLTRYLSVREDNAAIEAKLEGRDGLEVQTLRAERELLLSGPWGDEVYWERLFTMMDIDLTEHLPPPPSAD
jgi:hypothetical protein